MSTIIDKLKDKFGNFVLPVTNTKAVYDDNGNRLDNTLQKLNVINSFEVDGVRYVDVELRKNDKVNLFRLDENGGAFNFYTNNNGASWVGGQLATQNTISDAYNPYAIYSAGQYCIHNNILWKSKVNNNIGNTPTNGTYWEVTNVGNEISNVSKFDLLWTNSIAPNTVFDSQTVQIDTKNYNMFLIEFYYNSYQTLTNSLILLKGVRGVMLGMGTVDVTADGNITCRNIVINDNNAVFGNGAWRGADSTLHQNGNCAIPYKIYGVM